MNNPMNKEMPYLVIDFLDARSQGLNLNDWEQYKLYYGIGEVADYE